MRRSLRIAGLICLTLGLVAAALWRVIEVGVAEHYSSGWMAASSDEAATRGILLGRPYVSTRLLSYQGDSLRIEDAWVEQPTRVEYRWFLFRREVRQPGSRLVLRASADWRPDDFSCDDWLSYDDTVRLGQSGGRYFFDERHQPNRARFPDTLRLRVLRRSSCEPPIAAESAA